MATGFDEVGALGNIQGTQSGHPGIGVVAGYLSGLQRASRKEKKEKSDSLVDLENKAKMAQYQSRLRMNEMEFGQRLRQEDRLHAQATNIAGEMTRREYFQGERDKASREARAEKLQQEEGVKFPESGTASAGATITHEVDNPEAQSARLQSATAEMFPSKKKNG